MANTGFKPLLTKRDSYIGIIVSLNSSLDSNLMAFAVASLILGFLCICISSIGDSTGVIVSSLSCLIVYLGLYPLILIVGLLIDSSLNEESLIYGL